MRDGGAETLVKDYMLLMDKEQFDVFAVICFYDGDSANLSRLREKGISVIVVNTSGESIVGELEISGLPDGEYTVKGHLCDSNHNNVVTGKTCTGKSIEQTGEAVRISADGILKHFFSLEKNAFTLYRIVK
jgi:hypothetical protein